MCALHSPTHDAASRRLLRHRETQIRPQPQCVCGLARTANSGRNRVGIRPDGMAPLHNYHLCIIVTFAVKPHLRRTVQVEIRPGDLQDLADPGAGIVEEQKEGGVPDSEWRV